MTKQTLQRNVYITRTIALYILYVPNPNENSKTPGLCFTKAFIPSGKGRLNLLAAFASESQGWATKGI